MRTLLVLCLLASLCTMCTIRKRVHQGGWYIEWHKKAPRKSDNTAVSELPSTAPDTVSAVVEDTISEQLQTASTDTEAPLEEQVSKSKKDRDTVHKPFEPLGVTAAKLLVTPVIIAWLDDQSQGQETQAHFTLSMLFVIAMALCFVLGIISMVRYLRNPKAYKLNIWAALAILIPLVYAVIAVIGMSALF